MRGRTGSIRRLSLIGALVGKAAAYSVPLDLAKDRHVNDFATLAAMLSVRDLATETLTRRDKHYLLPMCAAVRADPRSTAGLDYALDGIQRLETVMSTAS